MAEPLDHPIEVVDHRLVEWGRVERVSYLLEQTFRYEYPGPVEDLRQRLVVFPAERHGGQRLVARRLEVSSPHRLHEELDAFGNRVTRLYVPRIEGAIDFQVRFLVERGAAEGEVPVEELRDPAYRLASPLTAPDERLRTVAAELVAAGPAEELADRACGWVYDNLTYRFGRTDVTTTAAQALELGEGVCQDHAHLMLALCRLLELPARYVSGHLLGEGATHAWVEVLAPDPARAGTLAVRALDPSHRRPCRPDYITVAVGRDYGDVAPTSGAYTAPYPGLLTAKKRAGITRLDYAA